MHIIRAHHTNHRLEVGRIEKPRDDRKLFFHQFGSGGLDGPHRFGVVPLWHHYIDAARGPRLGKPSANAVLAHRTRDLNLGVTSLFQSIFARLGERNFLYLAWLQLDIL